MHSRDDRISSYQPARPTLQQQSNIHIREQSIPLTGRGCLPAYFISICFGARDKQSTSPFLKASSRSRPRSRLHPRPHFIRGVITINFKTSQPPTIPHHTLTRTGVPPTTKLGARPLCWSWGSSPSRRRRQPAVVHWLTAAAGHGYHIGL